MIFSADCFNDFIPADKVSEIVVKAQKGDKSALSQIVKTHQKFVYSVAKRCGFLGKNAEMNEDILIAGNEGLLNAVRRFDALRGASFLRCAEFNVKSAMIECVLSFQQIHIPREKNRKLRAAKKLLDSQNENEEQNKNKSQPSSENEINEILKYDYSFTSLFVYDDSGKEEFDITEKRTFCENNDYSQNAEDLLLKNEISALTQRAISSVTKKEQFVLLKYYGFDGKKHSLSEIGKSLGITKQRVLQIKMQAESKLRSLPYLQNLIA